MVSVKAVLNQIVYTIKINYKPDKIILFGSCLEGKQDAGGDIDLLVIKETDKEPWKRIEDIDRFIQHTMPIDILVYTPQEIKERLRINDFFVRDIIEKGSVLYERRI